MNDDKNKKLVPVKKEHKILGSIITVVLFVFIALYIYDGVVALATETAINAYYEGSYENSYIYAKMAIFAIDYKLVILGGGVFMALLVGWIGSEECGLSKGEEVTKGKPISELILGFLFPIAGAVVLIPLYAVVGFLISFGHAQSALALLESPTITEIAYMHFNTLGAFLMVAYIIFLIGNIPACGVALFIVSLVSMRYLKRELKSITKPIDPVSTSEEESLLEHTAQTDLISDNQETPLHDQLIPTMADIQQPDEDEPEV